MDLVDLVLTVCLTANPTNCHDEHLYFQSRGSLVQCMSLAPPEIAKWSQTHPRHSVKRWKCTFPDKSETL
ncbi:MAG: hypothetical protein ABWY13_20335 [Mesorhizobium sp.]|jgi:hypothetical protein